MRKAEGSAWGRSRRGRRSGQALLLAAVLAALGAAGGAGAAEELAFGGHVLQSASAETPLSGGVSLEGGAATTLAFVLDARRDSASLRASFHFSALFGTETSRLWASLLANPAGADAVLLSTPFDPSAAMPDTMFLLALDDLALRWDVGSFAFEAGKTYANWGVGKAFSPADFFAEFDYSSGTPARRSKLMARATWFAGAASRVDVVLDPYASLGGTIAARAYTTAFESLACSLAAGLREAKGGEPLSFLASVETSFDLPLLSPYGEAAFTMALDGSSSFSYSLLGGGMARVGDATLAGEYLFSPDSIAGHGLFALGSLPLDEWTALSIPLLYYPESGALTTGINLSISELAGLSLGLGVAASRSDSQPWSGRLSLSARSDF